MGGIGRRTKRICWWLRCEVGEKERNHGFHHKFLAQAIRRIFRSFPILCFYGVVIKNILSRLLFCLENLKGIVSYRGRGHQPREQGHPPPAR